MKLIKYDSRDCTQLTEHFNVSEWKCKCGREHNILIADTLPFLLEQVMKKIGAVRGNISSGYRCKSYESTIGGTGSNTHQGYACDICFLDSFGKKIDSKVVVLALEDLGHQFGIGYKCGGNNYYTHIDVKPRKWFGDESKSMTKSCCTSFYQYLNQKIDDSIHYQVYDNKKEKWLPIVTNHTNEYAGNFGNSIGGIKIDKLVYRLHFKEQKNWSEWLNNNQTPSIKNFKNIDGVQIKNAIYRVHLKNGNWLPWVSKVDNTNQGYAGIYGKEIDAIQIKN